MGVGMLSEEEDGRVGTSRRHCLRGELGDAAGQHLADLRVRHGQHADDGIVLTFQEGVVRRGNPIPMATSCSRRRGVPPSRSHARDDLRVSSATPPAVALIARQQQIRRTVTILSCESPYHILTHAGAAPFLPSKNARRRAAPALVGARRRLYPSAGGPSQAPRRR